VGPGDAVQFAVHIMYASSDLSAFPTGYTPGSIGDNGFVTAPVFRENVPGVTPLSIDTGGSSTPTSSPAGNPPGTSPATTSNNGGDSLSGGAKAGIGIGVAVVVLALVGVLLYALQRRRNRKSKDSSGSTAPENDPNYRYDDKQVVGPGYSSHPPEKHYHSELDGQYVHAAPINELADVPGQRAQELPHGHVQNGFNAQVELAGVQEQRAQELPHSLPPPTYPMAPVLTPASATLPSPSAPTNPNLTAIALGPVSTQLDPGHQNDQVNSNRNTTDISPAPTDIPTSSPTAQPASSHVTVEDFELKYLEDEERRIRERKKAILASRRI
jgi:hypothetical protein